LINENHGSRSFPLGKDTNEGTDDGKKHCHACETLIWVNAYKRQNQSAIVAIKNHEKNYKQNKISIPKSIFCKGMGARKAIIL